MGYSRHNLQIANNKFTFDNVDLSNLVVVEKISRQLIPSVETKTTIVPGRHGYFFNRSNLGIRRITVSIRFFEDTYELCQAKAEQLAQFLYKDSPKKLILRDTELYNLAMISGPIELTKTGRTAEATLVFECYDPFNYGSNKTVILGASTNIANAGYDAPGTISLSAQASAVIRVILNNGDFIKINYPFVGGEIVVIDLDKEIVKINGTISMDKVDFSSSFFKIPKGSSNIKLENATGQLMYQERFL